MTDNKEGLKPCPCCNGKAELLGTDNGDCFPPGFIVGCTDCGLCTRDCTDKEEAIYLWNLRGGKE